MFLGTYTSEEWPNPIQSFTQSPTVAGTAQASTTTPTITSNNPDTFGYPGSVGTLRWYPNQAGPYQSTATDTKDWLEVKNSYDAYTVAKTAWEATNTAYDVLRAAYNTELAKERARNEDFLGQYFVPAFPIPDRPCPPDTFPAYDGLKIVYTTTTAFAAWTTEKADKSAIFTDNSSVIAPINSFRQGYLSSSSDPTASQTTALQANVWHTYGRLGQGAAVGDPSAATQTVKAYQWTTIDTTKTHHLMFSILPYDGSDTTGVAVSGSLTFKAKIVAWDTTLATDVVQPTQPNAAIQPEAANAQGLVASTVALAGILAVSLY